MTQTRHFFFCILLFVVFCGMAMAQVSTGTPAFGSFTSGPDVTNLGNLNVHYTIPIVSKPGRGLAFTYSLGYDSSIWTPISNGSQMVWIPNVNWGWAGQVQNANGYVTYNTTQSDCNIGTRTDPFWYYYDIYTFTAYIDQNGVTHAFHAVVYPDNTCSTYPGHPPGGMPYTATTTTTDGLGVYVTADPAATITLTSGQKVEPSTSNSSGFASATIDANGNTVSSVNGLQFSDTLGTTALSISGANPANYSYTDTNGASQSIRVNYSSFTVQTAFGCPGVTGEYNQANISLITSVVYPDGASYQFAYEPTTPTTPASYVTGGSGSLPTTARIGKITLPTGGTISYVYSGGSHGITCADGSTAGLTRTTINADTTNEVTTYVRSGSGNNWTTTITPPDGNQTAINFQVTSTNPYISTNNFYETSRTNYAGSSTVVGSSTTCYNGVTTPCDHPTVTFPFSRVTVFPQLANNFESERDTFFNNYGLVTAIFEYDFGATAGNVGSLLRHTVTGYSTLGNGIVDHPAQITVYDGIGNQIAQTTFTYDSTALTPTSGVPQHSSVSGSRGNVTSVSLWRNLPSATTLTVTNWFDDTGNLIQTQDPGGHYTYFSYADSWSPCGGMTNPSNTLAFATQVTNHLSQQTHTKHYPCTGQVYSTTDLNGNVVTQTYDSMLRPYITTRPDGGQTTKTYFTPAQTGSFAQFRKQTKIDSTGRLTDFWLAYDGYGREEHRATLNGENPAYDEISTCYDTMGRVKFVSYPVQNNGVSTGCTGAGDNYTYYFSGTTAYQQVNHGDGTYAYTQLYGRSAVSNDEGNGSSRVQKITQVDGLGRVTRVCEVSSANQQGGGSTSDCGVDAPASVSTTGYLTSYDYDGLGNLLHAYQGAQTRTFTYDSLSRLLSVTIPEMQVCTPSCVSGTTSYSYDNDGNLLTRVRPAANQTGGATITTTYAYDALHRLTQTSYSDSTYPVYHYYDESSIYGANLTNTIGRESHNVVASSGYSFNVFTYDSMGRVLGNWQNTPTFGGYSKGLAYTYDYLGDIVTASDGANDTFTGTYNQAARLTQLSSSWVTTNHPANLISGMHYGPFGMTTASLGNGKSMSLGYNSLGQYNVLSVPGTYSFTIPTTGGFASNGNIISATDDSNGTWNYTYDDFNRLASAAKSGVGTYTYLYDRYGNRWKDLLNGAGQQISFQSNNQAASGNGISYDAAGNVTNDGAHTYAYDAENRVTSVDSGVRTYAYDAYGRRVQRNNGSNHFDVLYDLGGRLVTEYYNGGWNRTEINAGGMHVATYVNTTSQTYFHHQDWRGDERVTTDASGATVSSCSNLPFGDGETCSPTQVANELFTNDEHDSESNTEHTHFRQMNSTQGRWLSPDPYMGSMNTGDPQSLNRYSYVGNDPINQADPEGLCGLIVAGINTDPNSETGKQLQEFAKKEGVNIVFPFTGGRAAGIGQVDDAGSSKSIGSNDADSITAVAIKDSSETPSADNPNADKVSILAWSGGAATTSYDLQNDAGLKASVTSVDYFSPGVLAGSLYTMPNTYMTKGSGFFDWVVNLSTMGYGKKHRINGLKRGHNLYDALQSGQPEANQLIKDLESTGRCKVPKVYSIVNPAGPNGGGGSGKPDPGGFIPRNPFGNIDGFGGSGGVQYWCQYNGEVWHCWLHAVE